MARADLPGGCPFLPESRRRSRRPRRPGRFRERAPGRTAPGQAGGIQQQPGCIAAMPRGEGDVAAQQVDPGPLEFIQQPGLRHRQQVQGLAERAGLHFGHHGGQDALGTPGRMSAVSTTDRSRNAAAAASPPRAWARPADTSSSAATSSSVPTTAWARCQAQAIRIGQRVGHLGQRTVQLPSVGERGRPVSCPARQRMPEAHPEAEFRARPPRPAQPPGPGYPAVRPRARPGTGHRTGQQRPAAPGCR